MESDYKFRFGAMGLVGLIFAPVGLLFLVLGIVIPSDAVDGSPAIFKGVFCGLGGLFLVLGVIFLARVIKENNRNKQLIASGNYVMADFIGANLNMAVQINGRNPYRAEFQFTDPLGMVHVFHSRDVMADPTAVLTGKQIRVYVDPQNYDNYYADIDSAMKIH